MARNRWLGLLTDAARAVVSGLTRSQGAGQGGASQRTAATRAPGRERTPSGRGPADRTPSPRPGPRPGAAPGPRPRPAAGGRPVPAGTTGGRGAAAGAYPGDFEGAVRAQYAPRPDGDPDPGEIVWTWVPLEEDHSQGKDRPVLLVGSDGAWLLGVMLTSKDHSRDARDEARWGRYWLDIGSGPWDAKGRDSEVRLDRVVRVDPAAVRREGAVVGRDVFDRVVEGISRHR
ncbi:type II toxin-antitoxin system PemK/MazF family toxin [Cellulosimicrobium funkei]|uniref:Type II toxin-antitoxin system PemK/MazF family toxin n=1 Tax=Cellulosimicrobium funkei TaxID=264251 RepID=A0A4Y8R2N2_9MICO|nr:type II toxin-antitoxin system PemK/MazF family toxin [Cellulosimicrobium funkei]TFF10453.1 type II toxin-antitoxin system PemK/MazF family toxin [Cellulosimicrobium funkei]TGA73654.1 type II toxin-antitoxin system PemK/MazF family toxin [Cellulosimicrobium terreum]